MEVKQIKRLIQDKNIHPFYVSPAWRRLRKEILASDKSECQLCKVEGRYTKATHVHHVNHVDKYPELTLAKTYVVGTPSEKYPYD